MEKTVRYQKFNAGGQIVVVERTFKTSSAMEKQMVRIIQAERPALRGRV